MTAEKDDYVVQLPPPAQTGTTALEAAIAGRRSVREFSSHPLALREVSQVLWAAQGVTGPEGKRAAPSAGALFPLETDLVAGDVGGLAPGVYRYLPATHALRLRVSGDRRQEVAAACFEQLWMAAAPATIVFAAVFERSRKKYGAAADRYVFMEVGHAGQNVHLQCLSHRLGTVMVAAFHDEPLTLALALPCGERPVYAMPVGYPA